MANILDYRNPITGQKGNLLDLKGGAQMVLGVFVLLGVYAGGSYLFNAAKARLPVATTAAASTTSGWITAGGGN